MKQRFSTLDLIAVVRELQTSDIIDLKVINIYDLDAKTYLIKLAWKEKKAILLFESGSRMHLTDFNWPKSMIPSNFSMKCRKHLNGKRLKSVEQLGIDRIVKLSFGLEENAHHLIIELYDRGNVILTDCNFKILQLLRRRTDKSDIDVKFAVNEIYPLDMVKQASPVLSESTLKQLIDDAKKGHSVKKILNPHSIYGAHLLEHCFIGAGLDRNPLIGKTFDPEQDIGKLLEAQQAAFNVVNAAVIGNGKGYLIQKEEKTVSNKPELSTSLMTYVEFHPMLFKQYESDLFVELPSFNKAIDEFFSKLSSQKHDQKAFKQKKAAHAKLENIKLDHEKRLAALAEEQSKDVYKAEIIQTHCDLVEKAIAVINSAIANQIDWQGINDLLVSAQRQGDIVACAIDSLQLASNQITLKLRDYAESSDEDIDSDNEDSSAPANAKANSKQSICLVKVDLDKTAYGNARMYFDKKRTAADKERRTNESTTKALKATEKKTKQLLKEVETTTVIKKARKTFWFEKFHWFISSENYLVISGMDQQQNELLVKKYLRPGDLYVHADLSGASTVVLKNPTGKPVPPKTLNEAGTMAICYSAAWESRVVTSAWWVYHDQVSKTAPTGEYISTGSFMIRGKRNYLLPSQLLMGFGVMFRLGDQSIDNHLNDRKPKDLDDVEVQQMRDKMIELDLQSEEQLLPQTHQPTVEKNEESPENGAKSSSDDEASNYPDTNINLQYIAGERFQLQRDSGIAAAPTTAMMSQELPDAQMSKEDRKQRMSAKQKRAKKKKPLTDDKTATADPVGEEPNADADTTVQNEKPKSEKSLESSQGQQPPKRGQKKRLKKIKEKYKDQDEEDREIMMQIIGSAGKKKDVEQSTDQTIDIKSTSASTSSKAVRHSEPRKDTHPNRSTKGNQRKPEDMAAVDGAEHEDEEEKKEVPLDVLDTLTGCPSAEDELLFCIPVCAPYTAMTSYRFKAKVTPGAGRRGKAAKTALQLFQASKDATKLEKDLLRSLKDIDISRNLPAKIRLQAPNLSKAKGK